MRKLTTKVSLLLVLFIIWMASAPGWALPSGQEVVRQVRRAHQDIRDYTVDLFVHIAMEGVKVPDISVRVLHKRPDKTKLQPLRGFAILPKGTLFTGEPFSQLGERFNAKVLDKQPVAGRTAYHLRLVSEQYDKPPLEMWVDCDRWTVLKVTHSTLNGNALTLEISYQLLQNRYWMPSRTIAHIRLPTYEPPERFNHFKMRPLPPSQVGVITATFRNYRINTGLPDSLFREKPQGRLRNAESPAT